MGKYVLLAAMGRPNYSPAYDLLVMAIIYDLLGKSSTARSPQLTTAEKIHLVLTAYFWRFSPIEHASNGGWFQNWYWKIFCWSTKYFQSYPSLICCINANVTDTRIVVSRTIINDWTFWLTSIYLLWNTHKAVFFFSIFSQDLLKPQKLPLLPLKDRQDTVRR